MSDSPLDFIVGKIGYKSYSDYLRGEHWALFSGGVRKKSCFCCGDKLSKLQVHHITYDRLGEELPADVVTVCDGCHICIHELPKSGTPLEKAHLIHRDRMSEYGRVKNGKPENKWVNWRKLLNKSNKQTIGELQAFLTEKELMNNERFPTKKAYTMGFARYEDGASKWSLNKYLSMIRANKQLEKLLRKGKQVPRNIYSRALVKHPNQKA